jgi:hypothetical protein
MCRRIPRPSNRVRTRTRLVHPPAQPACEQHHAHDARDHGGVLVVGSALSFSVEDADVGAAEIGLLRALLTV